MALENIRYATFETHPCVFNDTDAYVMWDAEWKPMPWVEVNHYAGLMSKEEFERAFPHALPIPKALFQSAE